MTSDKGLERKKFRSFIGTPTFPLQVTSWAIAWLFRLFYDLVPGYLSLPVPPSVKSRERFLGTTSPFVRGEWSGNEFIWCPLAMYLQIVQRSLSPPADVQLTPQGYLDPTALHTAPEAAREEQNFIILFRCYWRIIHYRSSELFRAREVLWRNGPFVFMVSITYRKICTRLDTTWKKKTVLWGNITSSEMGKQKKYKLKWSITCSSPDAQWLYQLTILAGREWAPDTPSHSDLVWLLQKVALHPGALVCKTIPVKHVIRKDQGSRVRSSNNDRLLQIYLANRQARESKIDWKEVHAWCRSSKFSVPPNRPISIYQNSWLRGLKGG